MGRDKSLREFASTVTEVQIARIKRLGRGRPRVALIATRSTNLTNNPLTEFARGFAMALKSESENGPVLHLKEKIGEVRNLQCEKDQRRSVAAILARKYREKNRELLTLASHSWKRMLEDDEVDQILLILEDLKR